ncbi:MAG: acetylornithine carbamoyltransferase [Ginsengibacter sp.]
MKNFISVQDVDDIGALVQKALHYKAHPYKDKMMGINKRMGCLYLNPSLRTRLSTQIAAQNLGMEAIVFNVGQEGWALEFEDGVVMNGTSVEHIRDAAPVLGNYFDILGIRTFPSLKNRGDDYSELYLQQFMKYAGIPIVSLESATLHPLQSLADIITINEHLAMIPVHSGNGAAKQALPKRPKVVLTWAPHVKPLPQCVANSFAQWTNAWGKADFTIVQPEGFELNEQFTTGATITTTQEEALRDADFVYVKNWSSYKNYGDIISNDLSWMLTMDKLKRSNNARVMHCLPLRRNVEIDDEVLNSPFSIITEEAGNRVWAAQAVLSEILKELHQ